MSIDRLRRRLTGIEIKLLKHLMRHTSIGFPIAVAQVYRAAFVPLWRAGLIDIWYRQSADEPGTRQFISITVNGSRLIDAILSAKPRSKGEPDVGPRNHSR